MKKWKPSLSNCFSYAMIGGFIGWCFYSTFAVAVDPPSPNCTLLEFAQVAGAPKRLAIIPVTPEGMLVWEAERPRGTVRSGPPYYVFDSDGRLVIRCEQAGEGAQSDIYWQMSRAAPPIKLIEAFQWCAPRPTASPARRP